LPAVEHRLQGIPIVGIRNGLITFRPQAMLLSLRVNQAQ